MNTQIAPEFDTKPYQYRPSLFVKLPKVRAPAGTCRITMLTSSDDDAVRGAASTVTWSLLHALFQGAACTHAAKTLAAAAAQAFCSSRHGHGTHAAAHVAELQEAWPMDDGQALLPASVESITVLLLT
jgi:hypothetical protein